MSSDPPATPRHTHGGRIGCDPLAEPEETLGLDIPGVRSGPQFRVFETSMNDNHEATLQRNLAALARTSPRTCELIRAAAPRIGAEFAIADDGAITGWINDDGTQRLLASKRAPLEEAVRLAETAPIDEAGAFIVLGFGLGHHVAALASRLRKTGVMLCFEPDVPLLRAVLERVDLTAAFAESNIAILTDAEDAAAITATFTGLEGIVALGVKLIEHPASRWRLDDEGQKFSESVTRVVRAMRTTVITTLVQVEITLRNVLMNLDHYAACDGVAPLRGSAQGRPAIVVAAGPSLRRNLRLLTQPGVRDRFVIIAVQTALKTLLAHGIKPHFVTALDHHEISGRFYEGLRADDVEGVTLVVEPKANAIIMDAYPGAIRCASDKFLDGLLGDVAGPPKGELQPGATVAHLAYYLARYLGCDPVILIGQDLGFTDGQYYAADAAIHEVWAGEINPFNTLEMLEWQRIVRGRGTLLRATDVFGRPIYTDEQMGTYLTQFERDFAADVARGLRIIDATEGGVRKRGAELMFLREALEHHDPRTPHSLPQAPQRPLLDDAKRAAVKARLARVRADVVRIAEHSREAAKFLLMMKKRRHDRAEVNRLIGLVHQLGAKVHAMQPAFEMVLHLNQTGTLRRIKFDRALELARDLPPLDKQNLQIDRDISNVDWIADAADRLGAMLDAATAALDGQPKITRDPTPNESESDLSAPSERRVAAVIAIDPDRGGLYTPRDLALPFVAGRNALQCVLERLARTQHVRDVVLLAEDVDRAKGIIGDAPPSLRLHWRRTDGAPMGERARAIGMGRLWTPAAWRGGLGGLTCYDEALALPPTAEALRDLNFDAAVIVGADWALVDPAIIDAVVVRHLESPERHKLCFSQAAPGFGACLLSRDLVEELSTEMWGAGAFASVGGLVGYVPTAPRPDPIARSVCVSCSTAARDAGLRAIPDAVPRMRMLKDVLTNCGADPLAVASDIIGDALMKRNFPGASGMPQQLTLELCTGRRTSGQRRDWITNFGESIERQAMTVETAERVIRELCGVRADLAVTFGGAGDPLLHPQWRRMVAMARESGAAGIHIRTDLVGPPEDVDALLDTGVDVISVDMMAHTRETYRRVMGQDAFAQVRSNLDRLLSRRQTVDGIAIPWVVPRITRCDATYTEIEPFFDHWLLTAGAAVIDPLPRAIAGERIEPLPRPRSAIQRRHRLGMLVLSNGTVPLDERDVTAEWALGDAARESVTSLWRRLSDARRAREADLDDHTRKPLRVPEHVA